MSWLIGCADAESDANWTASAIDNERILFFMICSTAIGETHRFRNARRSLAQSYVVLEVHPTPPGYHVAQVPRHMLRVPAAHDRSIHVLMPELPLPSADCRAQLRRFAECHADAGATREYCETVGETQLHPVRITRSSPLGCYLSRVRIPSPGLAAHANSKDKPPGTHRTQIPTRPCPSAVPPVSPPATRS